MAKKRLFKFKSLSSGKDLARVIDIIKTGEFYCPLYTELNDPMEGIYLQSGYAKEVIENILHAKLKIRICSFSHFDSAKDFRSLPMWAHYADNFCGCAIEIEDSERNNSEEIKRVDYLNQAKYLKMLNEVGGNKDSNKIAIEILTTKLRGWSYEREYRFITTKADKFHKIGRIKKIWVFEDGRTNSDTRIKRKIDTSIYSKLKQAVDDEKSNGKKFELKKLSFSDFS